VADIRPDRLMTCQSEWKSVLSRWPINIYGWHTTRSTYDLSVRTEVGLKSTTKCRWRSLINREQEVIFQYRFSLLQCEKYAAWLFHGVLCNGGFFIFANSVVTYTVRALIEGIYRMKLNSCQCMLLSKWNVKMYWIQIILLPITELRF
jgi:hypothetical protein